MIRGLPHKMAHLTDAQRNARLDAFERDEKCLPALANQTCTSPEAIHPLWAGLIPRGLRRPGYDGLLFELRTTGGEPVNIGYVCRAHIRDEATEVLGGTPPHKPSSSGRVDTHAGQYFPGVYDLEWVPL